MTVPRSLRHVRTTGLRALSPNIGWHLIALVAKTWLTTRCFTESTFVVIGIDRDRKTGAPRALLAQPESDGLNYAGAAFIALSDDARREFLAEVERLTTAWAAFKSSRLTDVKWCEPQLKVRVKHLAGSKILRHATLRALVR